MTVARRGESRAWVGPDPDIAPVSATALRSRFAFFEANYRAALPADSGAAILDFGCGRGDFLLWLKQRGYTNLSGVDRDARYAEFSARATGLPVRHAHDPLAFMEAESARFDLVAALLVVEYFPRAELSQWFRALGGLAKPGGALLVQVVNGAALSGPWEPINDPWVQNVLSEHSLRWALEDAGLQVARITDERYPTGGLRRRVWTLARRGAMRLRAAGYVLERGRDDLNPTLFGKYVIATARRPVATAAD